MSEQLEKKEIAKQYVKASVHYGHSPKGPLTFYMQNMVIIFLI